VSGISLVLLYLVIELPMAWLGTRFFKKNPDAVAAMCRFFAGTRGRG